ncbi:MAG: hypothetical protein CVV13_09610 [Gammaproteobacteria bacterium HGW-Gammaproteobacteria-3]|jgi:cholesterol transport system auxiliary component|nr:MAG: hypothetical protein CVV13_09610 [Gammaproteobacteria bacterium HGW-Gammaproteobacteria-3]
MKNLTLIALLLFMAGCSVNSKHRNVALHDLGPVTFAYTQETAPTSTIKVSSPTWLSDTRIYYRSLFLTPTVLKSYTLDRWIAEPGELLQRRFSLIKAVQGRVLQIQLIDFEQQFDAPERARSSFRFSAEVFRSGSRKPLGQRIFSYSQENSTPDAAGAIKSFSELSNRAANDLALWLDTLNASAIKE